MNRQELFENICRKKSFLCVGLDTDIRKIPAHLQDREDAIFAFNKSIIDATADLCVAYKPNLAFYESLGLAGWQAFEDTVRYIRSEYPDMLIIADAKRGDIGNTSEMYARSFFEHLDIHAVTVAPYMGEDSVKPFLNYDNRWVIVLGLTSNKGSNLGYYRQYDVCSRCYTRFFVRRYTPSSPRPFPPCSRCRCSRWQS